MKLYHFTCFDCGKSFYRKCEYKSFIKFSNDYGEWHGVVCDCGGMAKHIGHKVEFYMKDMVYFNDGKNRQISKAHLEDIRSRAVTPDGTVLRGKEGLKYNYSKGMKPTRLDVIR